MEWMGRLGMSCCIYECLFLFGVGCIHYFGVILYFLLGRIEDGEGQIWGMGISNGNETAMRNG